MADLRRREILVEHGEIGFALGDQRGQLLELSLGEKRGRMGTAAALDQAIDDHAAGGVGQALQLGERRMSKGGASAPVTDQDGALAPRLRGEVRDGRKSSERAFRDVRDR
jgi:hypothetical protein